MKLLQRSFAGGEITPELAGRLDLVKYQTGLKLARNFITLPHGPATRRPGFGFINEAKDSTRPVRVVPFSFSASQTAVLEFGHLYIRFHVNGGTLIEPIKAIATIVGPIVTTTPAHGYTTGDWVYIGTRYHVVTVTGANTFTTKDLWGVATTAAGADSARVYTLTTTYDSAHLFDLHYAQNADVITITHPSYPARDLARTSSTVWTITNCSFAAPAEVPTNVAVTPTIGTAGNESPQSYHVTAMSADGITESLVSSSADTNNNLTVAGNYNELTWDAVHAKPRYRAYKKRGGIYGYIGQVSPVTGGTTYPIAATRSGSTTVDVTTTGAHGYTTGDVVLIEDTGVPSLDGTWGITVDGASTFHYTSASRAAASVATGTVSIPVLQLTDDNVLADTTQSPPEDVIGLNTELEDYPAAVSFHEQRRWFAGTTAKPQVIFGTRTGTDANLTSSVPSRDADGMELRLAALQNNQIRHLVPLGDLMALTAGGEFRIFAEGAPAITPTAVSIKPQGFSGANNVQPVVTSASILYVQAQGSRIREIAYNWESSSYKSVDVSLMAPHRFNGYTITQLAFSRAPEPIGWAVRSDGTLAGLTYLPEQQVYGWHFHDTDGLFESACVVAEGNEDVLYVVAKRTIDARAVRYIERMRTRLFTDQDDAYYVDSGLTYDGSPVTNVTGLWHLEGEEVQGLADGAVITPQTVTNGTLPVALTTAASVIHLGLGYTSDLETLPLAIEGAAASGQGTPKNINEVHMRVSQSSLVKAGPDFDNLREYPARAVSDPYGSPPALRNGEISLSIDPSWNQDGGVCVRQDEPLPLTVLSMTLDAAAGG